MYVVMLISDYREYGQGGAFLTSNVYDNLDAAKDVAKDAVTNDPSLDHVKVYEVTPSGTVLAFIAEQVC